MTMSSFCQFHFYQAFVALLLIFFTLNISHGVSDVWHESSRLGLYVRVEVGKL